MNSLLLEPPNARIYLLNKEMTAATTQFQTITNLVHCFRVWTLHFACEQVFTGVVNPKHPLVAPLSVSKYLFKFIYRPRGSQTSPEHFSGLHRRGECNMSRTRHTCCTFLSWSEQRAGLLTPPRTLCCRLCHQVNLT